MRKKSSKDNKIYFIFGGKLKLIDMKKMILTLALMLGMGALYAEISAEVKMSPLFTDNMVLQQKTDAPVWGTADPGAQIQVMTSWNKRVYTVNADEDGKWMVKVATPKAGGPYVLAVKENGADAKVINNVLIGEVWLCSGQSNMEMPVKGWGKIKDYEKELKDAAKYPKIRLIEVKKELSPVPKEDFVADADGWMVCSPETLEEFSAAAYFFGREIHEKRNVPVGLINTSWGGTQIEAWMSRDAFQGVKDLEQEADWVRTWPADKEERACITEKGINDWKELQEAFDKAYLNVNHDMASYVYDDSKWDEQKFPGWFEYGFDGHVFIRREVMIPESWSGKPVRMHIAAVDDRDFTYFNGTLIGEMDGWTLERSYEIPAELVKAGKAVVAMRIIDTKDEGGINGKDDTFYLEGPDGDRVSLAGDWKINKVADYRAFPIRPVNMKDYPNWSTALYNAMINPLVPYAVKGAIWYQGCGNVDRAYQYRDLMSLMIEDWRQVWGYSFPFYITQLANYLDRQTDPEASVWAELREAQDIASRVTANAGMAVTIDIGEANDIHPKNKQEVGRRLALQALNKTYGMPVVCSGPVFEGYEIDGNVIRLRFSSVAKGLVAKGGQLEGFVMAGADRKFHWADAEIVGDCVEVTCKDVERPLAVRYAWANNPLGNLFNSEGLPAGPFRTDDWPGVSFGITHPGRL